MPTTDAKIATCPFDERSAPCCDSGRCDLFRKFASVHANFHNHFNLERHLVD